MTKYKIFIIFVFALIINFNLYNASFAIQETGSKGKYPDYACIFSGKDKCENFNRKIFIFNLKLNKYVVRPVSIVWASVVPTYGMDRLRNVYNNINFPIRVASCLLQKDFKSSKQEAIRFLTNTTLGIGGLYDPALTRFKIEPHQEDMEQVLAYYNVKSGPYLILPIVRGNIRGLVGKILDCPFKPTSYVGPFGAVATTVFALNSATYAQPMFKKIDDTYADPYDIARQVDGIGGYIKNSNLDREDVYLEKIALPNILKVNEISYNSEINSNLTTDIKPDIALANFNPQGSTVDSMRTAMFDNQKLDSSMWSDMSIWNRTFGKQIKISSINIYPERPKYKYRYILQENKSAPLAILYPSFGEGITADKSVVLAKILYDEGYSVLIQGSAFQWEFVNSMPDGYKPGLPSKDAEYLRLTTSKIIENIEAKKGCKFSKKILVGCSFGALTGIFVAALEENDIVLGKKTMDISNYIAINPPIEIFFALKQLDNYAQDWKNNPTDIKLKTAITAQKIIHVSRNISHKEIQEMPESMPFTEDEAKQVIGFIMKQKLSDVVFAVEHCSRSKKSNIYEMVNDMSFYDYAQKYLFVSNEKTPEQFCHDGSLYSVADFLQASKKYKIYHTLDDYFVNKEQLSWLKKNTKNNSVYFSNGSHLGFLYRKEFVDEFKKDINLEKPIQPALPDGI